MTQVRYGLIFRVKAPNLPYARSVNFYIFELLFLSKEKIINTNKLKTVRGTNYAFLTLVGYKSVFRFLLHVDHLLMYGTVPYKYGTHLLIL